MTKLHNFLPSPEYNEKNLQESIAKHQTTLESDYWNCDQGSKLEFAAHAN